MSLNFSFVGVWHAADHEISRTSVMLLHSSHLLWSSMELTCVCSYHYVCCHQKVLEQGFPNWVCSYAIVAAAPAVVSAPSAVPCCTWMHECSDSNGVTLQVSLHTTNIVCQPQFRNPCSKPCFSSLSRLCCFRSWLFCMPLLPGAFLESRKTERRRIAKIRSHVPCGSRGVWRPLVLWTQTIWWERFARC